MVTEEELKRVYGMFTDCWKLYKKFAGIRQTEDIRWERLVSKSDLIAKTYSNNKFVRNLLLATTQELERQSKEVKKK